MNKRGRKAFEADDTLDCMAPTLPPPERVNTSFAGGLKVPAQRDRLYAMNADEAKSKLEKEAKQKEFREEERARQEVICAKQEVKRIYRQEMAGLRKRQRMHIILLTALIAGGLGDTCSDYENNLDKSSIVQRKNE